jgi:hypothetical protein
VEVRGKEADGLGAAAAGVTVAVKDYWLARGNPLGNLAGWQCHELTDRGGEDVAVRC